MTFSNTYKEKEFQNDKNKMKSDIDTNSEQQKHSNTDKQ